MEVVRGQLIRDVILKVENPKTPGFPDGLGVGCKEEKPQGWF